MKTELTGLFLIAALLCGCNKDEEISDKDDIQTEEPGDEQDPSEDVTTLCTDNPSVQAVKLFNLLNNYNGRKSLSGTMANVNWNTNEAQWVFQHTGRYPAIACFDYCHHHYSPANWIDYSRTSVVEDWWSNNGIVSAGWHWNVPSKEDSDLPDDRRFYVNETNFDIKKALQSGTRENSIIMADLEKISSYLMLLKNKDIPVLWRPLHEASGGWFWWGAGDAASYRELWKLMFNHFASKGLNNLIWIWTSEGTDTDWYPGDEYVDIIGRDIYNKTTVSSLNNEYALLKRLYPDKLITLSECGNVAEMSTQWSAGIKWSWFMPWYDYDRTNDTAGVAFKSGQHMHADKSWWEASFKNPDIVTRDMMPSLK